MLVWQIVSAYMWGKNDWSFIWARCDYCQRMSDFDSCQFILIRMAYKVLISPRSNVTFDISLHEVCVRVGVRYVMMTKFSRMNSLPNFLTHGAPQVRNFLGWIVYEIFLPMVLRRHALRARESSAISCRQSQWTTYANSRRKSSFALNGVLVNQYKRDEHTFILRALNFPFFSEGWSAAK